MSMLDKKGNMSKAMTITVGVAFALQLNDEGGVEFVYSSGARVSTAVMVDHLLYGSSSSVESLTANFD